MSGTAGPELPTTNVQSAVVEQIELAANGAGWNETLRREELYLLAGLLRLPHLLGLADPFLGMLADQVQQALIEAGQALAGRGHLVPTTGAKLLPERRLATLIRASAAAGRTLVVARGHVDGSGSSRLIHRGGPGLFVEQEDLPDGRVHLAGITDLVTLERRLLEFLALPPGPAASGQPTVLPEPSLTTARRLALEGDAPGALRTLQRAGVVPEAAAALVEALADDRQVGSATVLLRDRTSIRYGESLAWLVGPAGAWQIQPLEARRPSRLRLVPAPTEAVQRRLVTMLWGSA